MSSKPTVLIIGTGEYVTGYVQGMASASDKKIGVVAVVCFDLRRRGLIGRIILAGTQGIKFPAIRHHFKEVRSRRSRRSSRSRRRSRSRRLRVYFEPDLYFRNLTITTLYYFLLLTISQKVSSVYKDMDTSFDSYPEDNVEREPEAYKRAMDQLQKGDIVLIFTPDNLHFEMCKEGLNRQLSVMVTKPIVQQLPQHLELLKLSNEKNALLSIEVHKRFDPMYSDCRQRIKNCGNFSYFSSYMSQPKFQLFTFKAWANFSDISYYLNSHHVDFHCWTMEDIARPEKVVAMASSGIANRKPYDLKTEDTITLMVQWYSLHDPHSVGTAVYTASWVAPKADVHTHQSFHYMGTTAEFRVDQAHRGYLMNSDDGTPLSINPLYMKYTRDSDGYFSGQQGYGYRSIDEFVQAAIQLRKGEAKSPTEFDHKLATVHRTVPSTAILHAGRLSLDNQGKPVIIQYDSNGTPSKLVVDEGGACGAPKL